MKDSGYYKGVAAKYLMPNYGTREVVIARAEGTRVWDTEGREYLDFLSGISVCNLGHCPKPVVEALKQQLDQFMHCSNLYLIPQQAELAARLCEHSFADRAFFANSGAEVNEAAIKLARLYSRKKYGEGRHEIITLRNSFHGRTIATITATGQEKVQKGFEPLVEGFHYAQINNLESVMEKVSDATCAIMLEPVQGEGGITAAKPEFLTGLRDLCNSKDILLIFDEIQCGMGRCGTLFAYQRTGVEPDIMTLAKALGNGFPIGAMLTREAIAEVLQPGTHGTTFGGNPLAMAAGLAVFNTMIQEKYTERVQHMSIYFGKLLDEKIRPLPNVSDIRIYGLMIGIELTHPGADIVKAATERGLLINCTMGNVLRLLPAFVVTEEECVRAADILANIIAQQSDVHSEVQASSATTTGAIR